MKTTTVLTIQCGCGFKAKDGLDAQKHVTTTGHTMTLNGTVRPAVDKGRMNTDVPKAAKPLDEKKKEYKAELKRRTG